MTRSIHAFFGGTFNPVHHGHLRMALELQQRLQLESVSLVPANVSPLKRRLSIDAEHRINMLRLAVKNTPQLQVDDREFHRSGPSFTVDTLHEIREEMGVDTSIVWAMGMDSFLSLHRWHRWESLLDVAHIVVMARPDVHITSDHEMHDYWEEHSRSADTLRECPSGAIVFCELSQLAISSTAIRDCVAEGLSPQFWLPESVWSYIQSYGLYRAALNL